jgi:hypothetical protein
MWHKKKWCNGKDFAPRCEDERIDFLIVATYLF